LYEQRLFKLSRLSSNEHLFSRDDRNTSKTLSVACADLQPRSSTKSDCRHGLLCRSFGNRQQTFHHCRGITRVYHYPNPVRKFNTDSSRKYEHVSEVSSSDYFRQLFELLQVDWLRLPLIQGLVTSASAGTEGLIRASRSALVEYINEQDKGQQQIIVVKLLQDLLVILDTNLQDDRYAIPAMEMLSFLLDSCFSEYATSDPR